MLTGGAAPPPPFKGPPIANMAKLTACDTREPIHRYGSVTTYPFRGGILRDFGSDGTWNVPWRSQNGTIPSDTSLVQLTVPGGLNTTSAYVDFGTRVFNPRGDDSPPGLTIGFFVNNSAPCTSIGQLPYAPSSMAYFDIGGFSMYTVGPQCTFPQATTYLTSPTGSSIALTGTFDKPIPFVQGRYTFVTFGMRGATIYVGGRRWKSSPVILWNYDNEPFSATRMRFYGGNQYSSTISILDLQIYDFELSSGQIAGLDRGLAVIC